MSPYGTVLKIQVQSCWKSLADRLLQEYVKVSFINLFINLLRSLNLCDFKFVMSFVKFFLISFGD